MWLKLNDASRLKIFDSLIRSSPKGMNLWISPKSMRLLLPIFKRFAGNP